MDYPLEYTAHVRVNYYDTDQMGVVWHGNYLKYFEDAREEMFRECGLPYSEIERAGVIMPIVETGLTYRRPARYDEVLSIKVRVADPPRARVHVEYEVLAPDGAVCVTGFTDLAFVSASTGAPCRPPEALRPPRRV